MFRYVSKPFLVIALALSLIAGCATEPNTRVVKVEESRDCVVLLHGLNRSWRAMKPMAVGLGLEKCRAPEMTAFPCSLGPLTSSLVLLPEADDGKVTVTRTKVAGMDDFLIVANSHRYITRSAVVLRSTRSFLETGRFLDDDRAVIASTRPDRTPNSTR